MTSIPSVKRVSQLAEEPAWGAVEAAGRQPRHWLLWAAAVIVLDLVFAINLYAPGPPQVEFTATGLTIHDPVHRLAVQSNLVEVAQVRIVDLDAEPGWRPVSNVKGFSNVYYRSGIFRVANGRNVQLFGEPANKLVLLPLKAGATWVLLEVKQPERFVAELKRDWSGH